jgi:methylation protein EvaC
VRTLSEFFCPDVAEKIVREHGQADAFLAANVMCHIPNIMGVVKGIKKLLKPTGMVMFEDPYLGEIIAKTSYDQIYDEHFYLFSVNAIKSIIKNLNLEVLNAERISTHGGSVRYYIQKKGARKISNKLTKILNYEKKIQITKVRTIRNFAKKCIQSKKKILQTIEKLNKKK